MKPIISLLLALLSVGSLSNHESAATGEAIRVYVFLHESCLISQHYTLDLKKLHEQYASERIVFEGIFPNKSSKAEKIEAFREKYDIPFALSLDHSQEVTRQWDAEVTPEVVVVAQESQKVLYKGRIDNAYYRVGKRRQVTTTSELKDVLEAISQGKPVTTKSRTAIGCFIERIRS
ncbi:MAG: redoxin domain-containing protein [Bacteroidota bacterium]